MNVHRKRQSLVPLLLMPLLVALLLAIPQAVSAASVDPEFVAGNPTCPSLMPGTTELKMDRTPSATDSESDGTLTVWVKRPSTSAGSQNSIDWESNITVVGVIVKGGPNANWYNYLPLGSKGDTYLTTPGDGQFGVSHVSFCYYPPPPPGNLKVTKVLDWNNISPVGGTQFEICITGPAPETTESCKFVTPIVDGEGNWTDTATWNDLEPGDYTVSEKNLPYGWTLATISSSAVTVISGETAEVTVTNKRLLVSLEVVKTVTTSLDREYFWEITKTVAPPALHLFEGQSGTVTYTVEVTKTGHSDSNWKVAGNVTISNTGDVWTAIASVEDALDDQLGPSLIPITVNCGVVFPYNLDPGDQLECTYEQGLSSALAGTNTVTVTVGNGSQFTGASPVDFDNPLITPINGSGHVTDSLVHEETDSGWVFAVPGATWTYPREFSCADITATEGSSYSGTITNVARIVETEQSDTADVDITCYRLGVSKDANPSFTRTYEWDIFKVADPASLSLSAGETGTVTYTILLTQTGHVDSDWLVSGTVTVENPAPMTATVTLEDALPGYTVEWLNEVCAATLEIAPGNTVTCDYAATPDGGTDVSVAATNTVTVTQWLPNESVNKVSDSAEFAFITPTKKVSDTVSVEDVNERTTRTFGPFTGDAEMGYTEAFDCENVEYGEQLTGGYNFVNTATIIETQQSATVVLPVTCSIEPATLGDRVWLDANGNGIQDDGEEGVAGVTVNLLDGAGNPTGLSTTTDASGLYTFTNLMPGTYIVEFVKPDGYSFSPVNQGGNPELDSDADPVTGRTPPITLEAGDVDLTWDAGLVEAPVTLPASIGDTVWLDVNGNGVQDDGEPGIPGVCVELLDANGEVIATTETDEQGNYLFDGLLPGDYTVRVCAENFDEEGPLAGTIQTGDPDDTLDNQTTSPITLEPGDEYLDADFGYRPPAEPLLGAIGDFVWFDDNEDGIQDAGEPGVAGVTVRLYQDNFDGAPIATTVTGPDGSYLFDELSAGTYCLEFVIPEDYEVSPPNEGDDPALDSDVVEVGDGVGRTECFDLAEGEENLTLDMGIFEPTDPTNIPPVTQPHAPYSNVLLLPTVSR